MSYGQVNADVIGTSVAGSNLGAGNASIMKNRIINGAFTVSQYNGTSSTTPSATSSNIYVIDRFSVLNTQASKLTYQQTTTAPAGFQNSFEVSVASTATVGSGDVFAFRQAVEAYNCQDLAWGTANAKTVTLSFWVQSSVTGTFGGAIQNYTASRSYPFTYTISSANTWTQISITIVGDTGSTWNTGNTGYMFVTWSLGTGTSNSGTAGTWANSGYWSATGATSVVGTSGATFYITGVQLEVGSSATGYEYRQYGQELALCQRYYEMSFSQGTAPANGVGNTYKFIASALNGGTSYVNAGVYCTEKRATPTMTFYRTDNGSSNGQPAYYSGGWNNGSSISPTSGTRAFYFNFAGTFSGLSCYFVDVAWTSSAEL